MSFRIFPPSRPDLVSPPIEGELFDLSLGGMRLLTNTVQSGDLHILHPNLSTSEQCRLEIELPDGQETLTLTGRVAWYDRNTEDHPFAFRMGIEFVEITPEDCRRIQALIKRSQSPPPASSD